MHFPARILFTSGGICAPLKRSAFVDGMLRGFPLGCKKESAMDSVKPAPAIYKIFMAGANSGRLQRLIHYRQRVLARGKCYLGDAQNMT